MNKVSQRILDSAKFKSLVQKRNSFAIQLSIALLVVYYGYIILIAYDKQWHLLVTKVATGMVMSWGIPLGAGVIIFTIIITALYVRRANTEYDTLTAEIIKESQS